MPELPGQHGGAPARIRLGEIPQLFVVTKLGYPPCYRLTIAGARERARNSMKRMTKPTAQSDQEGSKPRGASPPRGFDRTYRR